MTDRELLEAAAKAAGIEVTPHPNNRIFPNYVFLAHGQNWNPLTDDGDALRLAVTLSIDVLQQRDEPAEVWAEAPKQRTVSEWARRDPYAATRRAIVRAAAEIGRRK